MNVTTETDNHFSQKPTPFKCEYLQVITVMCLIIFVLSILFNSLILIAFYRLKKRKLFTFEYLIIALAVLSLTGSFHMPFVIKSNFSCRWTSGQTGCNISSFVMYFVGCTSIYLIMCITLERYYFISNSSKTQSKNSKLKPVMMIIGSVMLGLFWSLCPLLGWSHYTLETGQTHCSIDWSNKNWNVISYNISIFFAVFIIPLLVILSTSYKLLTLIKKSKRNSCGGDNRHRRSLEGINDEESILEVIYYRKWISKMHESKPEMDSIIIFHHVKKSTVRRNKANKSDAQKSVIVRLVIFAVGFILTWTPYGAVSMYSAFISENHISPIINMISAVFGKSSMFGATAYYLLSNKNLLKSLIGQNQFKSADWKPKDTRH